MSNFVPNKEHSRTVLLFCFHLKKTAAESYRMLREAYGDYTPSQDTCERWFRRFKSGDFDLTDKEHGKPPKQYEDAELETLLQEDDSQSQKQLAEQLGVSQQAVSNRLREMGKIQKVGKWVPHALNERQMEQRKTTCEILLTRYKRKSFLHRIITGDEKWIYLENPKRKKSWVNPGSPSTSTARPNRFGKKTMLCTWWDQKGVVYYELLKPGETVNTQRYQQQLIELNHSLLIKRPEYERRQHKVIFLHDNAPSHKAKAVCNTLETLKWEVLPHAAYSPDLAPSDYHLFASMGHALSEQHFSSYENVKKWLDEWFAGKGGDFYWRGIHKLPERWKKCIDSNGAYFE